MKEHNRQVEGFKTGKTPEEVLFVYNAESGYIQAALDIAHKIISPDTYKCSLCTLTHSEFTVRQEWKSFINELTMTVRFYHRDEFEELYPGERFDLPVILHKQDGTLTILLTANQISEFKTTRDLIRTLNNALHR